MKTLFKVLFFAAVSIPSLSSAQIKLPGILSNKSSGITENAGGDRDQAKSIFAGECDVAIANTYYMAAMETSDKPEQREWAKSIKILFPNAGDRGTHVDISGTILAKNAPNKDAGIKLIEFLASDEGQKIYAEAIDEYPLRDCIQASERVKAWGALKADKLPLDAIAKNRKSASEIMDKVGFDQGPGA